MRKLFLILTMIFALSLVVSAQTAAPAARTSSSSSSKPPIFRANKDQVIQAQKMLKLTETGKLSKEDRAALKTWQSANGLKATGTLNRATLEKMNIALTDKQKEIPVSANSFASGDAAETKKSGAKKAVFRANKDQVGQAQKMLKEKGFFTGDASGKLDDATRDAIRKFQESVGMKVTGTLNKETLEKMNIALTDKQKEM